MPLPSRALRFAAASFLVAVPFLLPSRAAAVDGVVEINQARANAGSITAGDTPGFLVQITTPGSYRLTSELVLRAAIPGNTDVIEISADDVSLDMNGFMIRCTRPAIPATSCSSLTGDGNGITINGRGARITNGVIKDMPQHGVNVLQTGSSYLLEAMRIHDNGDNGVQSAGDGIIRGSQLIANGVYGIHGQAHQVLILDSMTDSNGMAGVRDTAAVVMAGRSHFQDGTSGTVGLVDCIFVGNVQTCP